MNKLPAFQFYPADWRKDSGVQALSYHDRGVWFEILCLMHESEQRGKLLLNGRPMPDEVLARLLGLDKQILTRTLATLIEYGVATRDEIGAFTNRRMVRDEHIRQVRSESGKKGGNPALLNQSPNQNPTTLVKQKSTPSSSVSSSTSSSPSGKKKKAATPSDDEWLKSLSDNPAYKNLPVLIEFEKAKVWAGANGRQCTRRFFVNWLNRATPMKVQSNGHRPDPGKPREQGEAKIHCKRCLDTHLIDQKPNNAKYEWELVSVPCPDCAMEKAA